MDNKKIITADSMRKLLNRSDRTLNVNEELKNVCRFVHTRYVQGKTIDSKMVVDVIDNKGLQIENTVYLLDGSIQFVGKSSKMIVSEEKGIPDWADGRLVDIYTAFINRINSEENA